MSHRVARYFLRRLTALTGSGNFGGRGRWRQHAAGRVTLRMLAGRNRTADLVKDDHR